MAENCKNAYRKRGKNAVYCKAIEGDYDFCACQYLCPNTQRWEANKATQCVYKKAKPVK